MLAIIISGLVVLFVLYLLAHDGRVRREHREQVNRQNETWLAERGRFDANHRLRKGR